MEPVGIVSIITTVIPAVTTIFKKVFKTEKLKNERLKKGVNSLIPIILGILANSFYLMSQGEHWTTALAIGLGSGGAASSIRNVGVNFTRAAINEAS